MDRVQQIAQHPDVKAALAHIQESLDEIVTLAIAVQQIPAPTFEEEKRAAFIESRFQALGLQDVERDGLNNVYGRLRGRSDAIPVILSAHLDTVFSEETDLSVSRSEQRVAGPGIVDNALGLAGLLTLAETLGNINLQPQADIWFVANVGEEGLGDLCGMRAVVDRFGSQARYIILEGGLYGYVCHQAIGVRRFRVEVTGPGGHSWGSFGTANAIHVLARLITTIDALEVPVTPKTTYNVGVIQGGTTVNAIAQSAYMLLDLRSEDVNALAWLVREVERMVEELRAKTSCVQLTLTPIGNRPIGEISRESPLVQWAVAALQQVGCTDVEYTIGSTDANVPLSRGLPAVCVGLTRSGNTHRLDEYMEIEPIPAGVGQALLLTLAATDS